MDEIGIKFNCHWVEEGPLDIKWIQELNEWRHKLYELGLIGVYANGIGYGNISVRFQHNFIITGTATGKIRNLTGKHFTQVTDYDLERNSLTTVGPIKASSESLTHAVIYGYDKHIGAVIHVHHLKLWQTLLNHVPTTNANIEYGTTAMAKEIIKLFNETNLAERKIFAMAGHEEGIVSFGETLTDAAQVLLSELDSLNNVEA
jgi:ribulose-5-phosphate 4-epimerase/fuculose-1-phosphate aldolase